MQKRHEYSHLNLEPSQGPVFLEGRLVLDLSFRPDAPPGQAALGPSSSREDLLEEYGVWDDVAQEWNPREITLHRYEYTDLVTTCQPPANEERPIWEGALDTRKRIIDVPDLDMEGYRRNAKHRYRWKRC